ncbi:hypothetical protein [Streptomyces sp. NPDC048442]|uniref:hypothetical protein n=1 Tax=Streptomyces sp. NPDC048442 TaxID=3154823 RepID=UPI00342BA895
MGVGRQGMWLPAADTATDSPSWPTDAYAQLSADAGTEPASSQQRAAEDSRRTRSGPEIRRDPARKVVMNLLNDGMREKYGIP